MGLSELSFLLVGAGIGITLGREELFFILFGGSIILAGFALFIIQDMIRLKEMFKGNKNV